jgi:hypothetical protein
MEKLKEFAKVGWDTPEETPAETVAPPMATPVAETGSHLR